MLTKGSRAASSADELKVPSFIMQESISPPGRNLALKFKDYLVFNFHVPNCNFAKKKTQVRKYSVTVT